MKLKILIVEDDYMAASTLQLILERSGYFVMPVAGSVPEALKFMERKRPDMVLLDVNMEGRQTGVDLGNILGERNVPFIYLAASATKETMRSANIARPYGLIVKPFREEDVLVMLDVAWYLHRYSQDSHIGNTAGNIPGPAAQLNGFGEVIASSKAMKEVLEKVNIIGRSDTSVLIYGESGTGKELIAKTIHKISRRNDKPLIVVNCAALPASLIESELFGHEKGAFTGANFQRIGKFEQADGGTIFLDEIGELPLDLQVKFLRVLQEMEIERIGGETRKIDVRVIAATNRNLEREIEAQTFRLDLYYRLNIFPVYLPALRERKEDLLPLASFFLSRYAEKERKNVIGFSEEVKRLITGYSWPGNVRELENLMARSVLLAEGNIVDTLVLPRERQRAPSAFEKERVKTMEENERDHILMILERCDWKVYGEGGAAELLDINVSTLNSRMRKLGIVKPGRK